MSNPAHHSLERIGADLRESGLRLLALFLVGLACFGSSRAADAREMYPETRIAPDPTRYAEEMPPGTGYVPPPIDLSHLRPHQPVGLLSAPGRFDWRERGKVTPVKNQGYCGSCYAFAAIANLESRTLIEDDSLFDFSENNVKECEWFEASCGGGNDWMVANYLTSAGTVLEACDPYVAGDVECDASCRYRKTLREWNVISGGVPAPVEVLKTYMMMYGPVYSTLYVGSGDAWRSEFSAYDGSYTLFNPSYHTPNHAVLIVGWDDTLSHAGGQGAWIVKNSWGASWGGTCGYGAERGYFTIAYGSAAIGANSSFAARLEDYDPADTLLHYDEGGFGGSIGIVNSTTIWGLCKFEVQRDIEVKQVELWTVDATPDIDIYIYDDFAGGVPAGLLTSIEDNAFDLAGYHSIALDRPLPVSSGEVIYVVAKITNSVSKFPLAYDSNGPRSPGCCYMSSNGACFYEFTHGDLGIRLRGSKGLGCAGGSEVPAITDIIDVPGDAGGYVSIRWDRSLHDDTESGAVKRYRIWRKRREELPSMLAAGLAVDREIGGPYQYGLESPAWEAVGTVEADGRCCYGFAAPTQCNCTPSDTCWTYFCVTAHTGVPGEHFDSPVRRGFSIDNHGMLSLPDGTASDGTSTTAPPVRDIVLRPPQPNPSRDGFEISFELAAPEWVDIAVYDVRGRRIAQIEDGPVPEGQGSAVWEPGRGDTPYVPPGIYFLRLRTASQTRTARLVLID
jgi:C1A family cysteine protease